MILKGGNDGQISPHSPLCTFCCIRFNVISFLVRPHTLLMPVAARLRQLKMHQGGAVHPILKNLVASGYNYHLAIWNELQQQPNKY